MNYKTNKLLLGAAVVIACFGSCTKRGGTTNRAVEDVGLENKAIVQLYNVTIGSQRNFIYNDGKRLNGASLTYTAATFTPLFPSLGPGFAVTPGVHTFVVRDTLNTSTAQPALSFAASLEHNTQYTIFTYDTVGTVKQKTVRTDVEKVTDTTSRIRFAHFAWLKNATPPALDLFSKKTNTNLFSNVAYTEVTPFITYGSSYSTSTWSDTLLVRETGTQSPNLDTLVVSPSQKRSYTLVFRGRYATNGAGGGTFPRTLTLLPHQ